MKRTDLIRRLEKLGYWLVRDKGGHSIYKRSGSRALPVPRHSEVDEITAKSILKIAEGRG